jgi:hypothetical protein
MSRLLTCVAGLLAVAGYLAACGKSNGTGHLTAPSAASAGKTVVTSAVHKPSMHEVILAQKCLGHEDVRPARHSHYKLGVPTGSHELTVDGRPMTPEEYDEAIHKCVSSTTTPPRPAAP